MQKAFVLGRPVYCDLESRDVVFETDPAHAADALSVLRFKSLVKPHEARAGILYGFYRGVVYGRAWPSIGSAYAAYVAEHRDHDVAQRVTLTDEDREKRYEEITGLLRDGEHALRDAGREARRVCVKVCVEGQAPFDAELPALTRALHGLAAEWGLLPAETRENPRRNGKGALTNRA